MKRTIIWRFLSTGIGLAAIYPAFGAMVVIQDLNPRPFPAGTTEAVARTAVLRGLDDEQWAVVSHSRGAIRILKVETLDREAMVDLRYDSHEFSIHYVSSSNLSASTSAGKLQIEHSYKKWIGDLIDAIREELPSQKNPAQ